MKPTNYFKYACFCFLLASAPITAQQVESLHRFALTDRIQSAPESVLSKFREAGMEPINHTLNESEMQKISETFSLLPPLHQKILKAHLHSISFMDNMPNTALTSPIETAGETKMFNITFRAEILNETISEWATWKENTYFMKAENNEYQVSIDAGNLNAFVYVLLHEVTHVVDAVLNITPHSDEIEGFVADTPFTATVWQKRNEPREEATTALLETTRFRSGKTLLISSAPAVYKALEETPFASLYSMASWHEDLAELVTIYHLTRKLNQPYKIMIKKNGATLFIYEPLNNSEVVKRQDLLKLFYT